MDRSTRIEPTATAALAMLLSVLALYGCWSMPGLAARWGVSGVGVALLIGWVTAAGWAFGITVRRPRRWEWAALPALVVASRLAAWWLSDGRESPGDPHWYLLLARSLLAGHGMALDDPALGSRAFAEFPPAYPLLLAGWSAVAGLSMPAVLTLSTLLDVLAAMLIARLGLRMGEPAAGRGAAALYLLWPSVILSAPLAQKESLEIVLVLLLALGWLAAERPGRQTALAIGVPAALLTLTQPGLAALAGLVGLVQVPRLGWPRVVAIGAPAAGVAALVMLPWWVRNWFVLHAFVPLTSIGGLSLWIGENPDATGNWMPYPRALVGLPELEVARAAGQMAIDWMAHHPLDVLRLNAAKFLRAAGVEQFPLIRLAAMHPAPTPAVTAALLPLTQVSHVLMLGAEAASLLVRRRPALTAMLVAVVLQLMLFGIWFEFGERHREALTPFLLLGVAVAACAVLKRRTVRAVAASARSAV